MQQNPANVENLVLGGTAAINGTGNDLANTLTGNGAANTLNGGLGADTLVGGAGNDTYVIDDPLDRVTELADEGRDTVQSSISIALDANIEMLTLTGTASIDGTGNVLDNTINGNRGANVLDGGAGADTLAGGAGNDTYVIDSALDVVVEAANAGTDTVRSAIAYTLDANLENLTLTGSAAIDGTGNTANNVMTGNDGDNILNGGGGADTLAGGLGNDTYVVDSTTDTVAEAAVAGTDLVRSSVTFTLAANIEALQLGGTLAINGTGNAAANLLQGNAANNTLSGGGGNDILQGGDGVDTLTDTAGNNLFDGGAGNDVLGGGTGNDFFAGGAGNDTINTATGADLLAFNRGDGQDTVVASTGKDNTISLGRGILYADLQFVKNANDLVLLTGASEQVTLKNWYANTANRSVAKLQVVIGGGSDYDAGSASAIRNRKVEQFNFDGLVGAFDQARTANPRLTSWSLSTALLDFHLGGSDSAAIGGDLAYQYATTGNLSAMSMNPALAVLGASQFGMASQSLQPAAALQDPSPRLQ